MRYSPGMEVKPEREVVIEPLEDPVPRREAEPIEPAVVPEPSPAREPVPA